MPTTVSVCGLVRSAIRPVASGWAASSAEMSTSRLSSGWATVMTSMSGSANPSAGSNDNFVVGSGRTPVRRSSEPEMVNVPSVSVWRLIVWMAMSEAVTNRPMASALPVLVRDRSSASSTVGRLTSAWP